MSARLIANTFHNEVYPFDHCSASSRFSPTTTAERSANIIINNNVYKRAAGTIWISQAQAGRISRPICSGSPVLATGQASIDWFFCFSPGRRRTTSTVADSHFAMEERAHRTLRCVWCCVFRWVVMPVVSSQGGSVHLFTLRATSDGQWLASSHKQRFLLQWC